MELLLTSFCYCSRSIISLKYKNFFLQDLDYPECKSPVKMLYEEDKEKFSSTKYLAVTYKNLVFFRREVA